MNNFAEQIIQISFKTLDRGLAKFTLVTVHILTNVWQNYCFVGKTLIKYTATVK